MINYILFIDTAWVSNRSQETDMSYFRTRFRSFEEFQREVSYHREELGKDELELLRELEDEDNFDRRPRQARAYWE